MDTSDKEHARLKAKYGLLKDNYYVDELPPLIGVGRTSIHKLFGSGKLKFDKEGKRTIVADSYIIEYRENRAKESETERKKRQEQHEERERRKAERKAKRV